MPPLVLEYFTDPACIWSYVNEPALHRILERHGPRVQIVPRMWPLWDKIEHHREPGIEGPRGMARHWHDVAQRRGFYVNPRLWDEDPVASCRPACRAYHAARVQGEEIAWTYLRLLRLGYMTRNLNLSRAMNLHLLAREAARSHGLDVAAFVDEYATDRPEEALRKDEARAEALGIRASPTLVLPEGTRVEGPVETDAQYLEAVEQALGERPLHATR